MKVRGREIGRKTGTALLIALFCKCKPKSPAVLSAERNASAEQYILHLFHPCFSSDSRTTSVQFSLGMGRAACASPRLVRLHRACTLTTRLVVDARRYP